MQVIPGVALARQAARSDRAWLDFLVLFHQGKRTLKKAFAIKASQNRKGIKKIHQDKEALLRQSYHFITHIDNPPLIAIKNLN